MKEITATRFNDILYKFFMLLTCFGFLMLAFDLITLANGHNLYMFRYQLDGWNNLIALLPVLVLIAGCWYFAGWYRKQSESTKWR